MHGRGRAIMDYLASERPSVQTMAASCFELISLSLRRSEVCGSSEYGMLTKQLKLIKATCGQLSGFGRRQVLLLLIASFKHVVLRPACQQLALGRERSSY